jgi:hypothetical protein
MKVWSFQIISFLVISLYGISFAQSQEKNSQKEFPEVIKAVAPSFPPVLKKADDKLQFEVIVELVVNAQGVPNKARAVECDSLLLCKTSEEAAIRWQFAAFTDKKEITLKLKFIFTLVDWDAGQYALTPIFYPPNQIEVKCAIRPHVDINVTPRPTRKKNVKKSMAKG